MRKVVIIRSAVLLSVLSGCSAGSVTLAVKTPLSKLPAIKVAAELPETKAVDLLAVPTPAPVAPAIISGSIETLTNLKMLTLEEMPLEAEVILSNGKRSRNIKFENKTPELLTLKNNIVVANEPGEGKVLISSSDFPNIEATVKIKIERSNIAIIDLEIDFE